MRPPVIIDIVFRERPWQFGSNTAPVGSNLPFSFAASITGRMPLYRLDTAVCLLLVPGGS